jgi:reverse gyrase|tara:strand:+ start:1710 stop:1832 length:123 start_codon:yes stop_codon:yes gene_type:complete
MFKKTYEKYTSEEETENLKKQIDTGEMSQAELDAVMKFIK